MRFCFPDMASPPHPPPPPPLRPSLIVPRRSGGGGGGLVRHTPSTKRAQSPIGPEGGRAPRLGSANQSRELYGFVPPLNKAAISFTVSAYFGSPARFLYSCGSFWWS